MRSSHEFPSDNSGSRQFRSFEYVAILGGGHGSVRLKLSPKLAVRSGVSRSNEKRKKKTSEQVNRAPQVRVFVLDSLDFVSGKSSI